MKKVIRRAIYGLIAWLFVFILSSMLIIFVPEYLVLIIAAAPVAFFWLAKRCLRKKKPDWGSEGLKAGGIWLVVFGIIDFVVVPLLGGGPYSSYIATRIDDVIYIEVLVVPWLVDKIMTGLRKI